MPFNRRALFANLDTERLIEEVQARPILYMKSLPEYTSTPFKEDAWKDIGTVLLEDEWKGLTSKEKAYYCKELRVKWKHLRDNFRRELQAQAQLEADPKRKKKCKYRYYENLLFLSPYMTDVQAKEIRPDAPECHDEDDTSCPATAPPRIKLEADTPTDEQEAMFYSQHPDTQGGQYNYGHANSSSDMDVDEDKTFCMSLVPSLKRMDEATKLTAKIEILKVLQTIKANSNK